MTTSHHAAAEGDLAGRPVRCAILTVSDTRTAETDAGGDLMQAVLEEFDHVVIGRRIVPDEPGLIRAAIESWLRDPSIQVILTTGGTGISQRDTTIEVVRSLLSRELEGFGELFRMLSWQSVGGAAMLSRATGGLISRAAEDEMAEDAFLFAVPGSVDAVETATRRLIAPELRHLVWERRR